MKTKTWIAGLASATLVATVGVAVVGTGSSNADPVANIGSQQPFGGGILTWKTTLAGVTTVSYSSAAAGTTPQTLAPGNQCALTNTGTQYLQFPAADITGPAISRNTPASIGFKDRTLGVRSGNESNGNACRQVNAPVGEAFSIAINPTAVATAATATPAAISANLDVNVSSNATIEATLYRGTAAVGLALLKSGRDQSYPTGYEVNPYAQEFNCNKDVNSGPQSAFNNNCYWEILPLVVNKDADGNRLVGGGYIGTVTDPKPTDLLWDRVVLKALTGDFGVQGGDAWPTSLKGSAGTTFNVTGFSDGTIGCYNGTAASLLISQAAASIDPRSVVTRLSMGDPTATCVLKPYTYSDTANTSTFRYPTIAGQETSQFVMRLPRDHTPTLAASMPQLPNSFVDWEDQTPAVEQTLRTCIPGLIDPTSISATDPYKVPSVNYQKIRDTYNSTTKTWSIDQSTRIAGLQYACIYSQDWKVTTTGGISGFDYIYFHGDIKLRSGA